MADPDTDSAKKKKPSDAPISIGALAGVGFPRPLSVEGLVILGKTIGLGGEYSILPPITVSSIQASMSAVAGDFRIFPFRSPFFFGVKGGLQRLDATAMIALSAETWFVTPRIGAMWTWGSGIAFGMEAGVQIPVSTTTRMPGAPEDVVKLVNALASTALPSIDLIRIGLVL